MTPTNDGTETQPGGLGRRRMIGGAVLAGGAAWAAPTLLSVSAAAAASGDAPPAPSNPRKTDGTVTGLSFTLTEMNLNPQPDGSGWILLAGIAFSDPAGTAVPTVSGSTPGWTLYALGSVPGGTCQAALFIKVIDGSVPTQTITIDFSTTVEGAGIMLSYPTGTGWEPVGPPAVADATTGADISAASITTTSANRTIVYFSGYDNQGVNPVPTGYTDRGFKDGLGFSLNTSDRVEPAAATVPATVLAAPAPGVTQWVATQVAIFA